jgi:hypothetical protein
MSTNLLTKYKSHKEVHAAKITQITETKGEDPNALGAWLVFGELAKHDEFVGEHVKAGWLEKHKPEVGGYFVRYEGGYTSYSPAAAFEGGYTAL